VRDVVRFLTARLTPSAGESITGSLKSQADAADAWLAAI
jgi:hypothetical protein